MRHAGQHSLIAPRFPGKALKRNAKAECACDIHGIHPADRAGQPHYPAVHKALWEIMWEKNWACWNADFHVALLDRLCLRHGPPLIPRKRAVGDICIHPFNQQGELLETSLTDCLIGVGVQQLRMTPCRIAVAAGIQKADAVIGALRTGLKTHRIVDTLMAPVFIERCGKSNHV